MSRINRVQDIGTQDVTFDDSDFGFSVTNTSVPSAHNAAAAAQHQEAASANRERARLNSLRAEEATQKHMQRAHENAQTSRSNTSRASRGAGFHDPHVAPTGDWAVYAPTSHAREAASTTATANTQKQVVINQVMGEQTIGFVNNYHSSTAAPPTDCNSTTGVNTVSHLCHTWLTIRRFLK
jgi:hypothetical protein